ncbi:MAG: PIG-L family deacetylase [Anaerolineae bacterium]
MTPTTPHTLLVILAHPDDESFPIGGTLAKYAAEGVRVSLICATRGEAGIPGLSPEATGQLRQRELRAAAAALGLAEVRFLGYPDGQLAQADPEDVIGQLVKAMGEIQPQAVITFGPDGISAHPDHLAIHRFTTQAFDRANLLGRLFYLAPSAATLQGCGVVPSQEVAGGPVAAIDVGDYLVTKVRAMQCHASQKPPYLGPPEEEATRLTCHEYFTLVRPVEWQSDLTDLFEGLPSVAAMTPGRTAFYDQETFVKAVSVSL